MQWSLLCQFTVADAWTFLSCHVQMWILIYLLLHRGSIACLLGLQNRSCLGR